MGKLWAELVNTAIKMDDQLGEMSIPDTIGCTRNVIIDGKRYTIRVTVDRDDE